MQSEVFSTARLAVIVRHNVTLLARDPGPLVAYTVMPVLLMTALRPLYSAFYRADDVAGLAHTVSGAIVMFSLFALNVVGHNILNEKSLHTWDRLRASPAGMAELLLGKFIPLYVMLLVQELVILSYAVLAFKVQVAGSVWQMVSIGLTWPATVLAVGLLLSAFARSHAQLGTITDIGALFLTLLGGALTPLTAFPGWLRELAPLSPGYWAVLGFRDALTGQPQNNPIPAASGLALVAMIAGGIAVWRFTHQNELSRLT